MTFRDWETFLERITYKHNFILRMRSSYHFEREHLRLEVLVSADCSRTNNPLQIIHGYQLPDWKWDDDRALSFVRRCIEKTEQHEMMEFLKFDGKIVEDPHADDIQEPALDRTGDY